MGKALRLRQQRAQQTVWLQWRGPAGYNPPTGFRQPGGATQRRADSLCTWKIYVRKPSRTSRLLSLAPKPKESAMVTAVLQVEATSRSGLSLILPVQS